jgi:hypothetical protein
MSKLYTRSAAGRGASYTHGQQQAEEQVIHTVSNRQRSKLYTRSAAGRGLVIHRVSSRQRSKLYIGSAAGRGASYTHGQQLAEG